MSFFIIKEIGKIKTISYNLEKGLTEYELFKEIYHNMLTSIP